MILYNIKTGLRYLVRQKNISFMNLLGLTIGMSVAILIFYFVNFERSYDNFHKESSLIFRVISVNKGTGGTEYRATTPLPLPEVVKNDVKAAGMTTGLTPFLSDDEPVLYADRSFYNISGYATDSNFLKIFNFPVLAGSSNNDFDNPGAVMLTKATATKLFGNENPMGKELVIGDFNFTVSGILKDLPENSIFKFDLLVSHLILKKIHPNIAEMWWGSGSMTFIKTHSSSEYKLCKDRSCHYSREIFSRLS